MGNTKRIPKRNPRKIGKRKHLLEEEENKKWKDDFDRDSSTAEEETSDWSNNEKI